MNNNTHIHIQCAKAKFKSKICSSPSLRLFKKREKRWWWCTDVCDDALSFLLTSKHHGIHNWLPALMLMLRNLAVAKSHLMICPAANENCLHMRSRQIFLFLLFYSADKRRRDECERQTQLPVQIKHLNIDTKIEFDSSNWQTNMITAHAACKTHTESGKSVTTTRETDSQTRLVKQKRHEWSPLTVSVW